MAFGMRKDLAIGEGHRFSKWVIHLTPKGDEDEYSKPDYNQVFVRKSIVILIDCNVLHYSKVCTVVLSLLRRVLCWYGGVVCGREGVRGWINASSILF